MSAIKLLALFTCAILTVCDAKFVDTLTQCSIRDDACQAALFTSIMKNIKKSGIPEFDIPPVDPFQFNSISLFVLDLAEMKITEGKFKGITNCVVDSYKTEMEKGYTKMALICTDIEAKGKYMLSGSNPILKEIFKGESIRGDGTTKVQIEKLRINLHFIYDVVRKGDGELYFKWTFKKILYDYKILGKVSFSADKIFLGETDATALVLGVLNSNAKFALETFGRSVVDQAMEFVYKYGHKFFESIPIKYLITEDLSKYMKN